ncbi:MAG: DUF4340 domain-containing protein [Pirellulales bacterium]|jgi:hypothetical protein|nr:DUF4340 domain-containing protein [Pirellulales bacterium]
MNESNKTVIYVVVCATVWSIALFSRQDTASNTTSLQEIAAARVGQELFDNFEANNAKRLKVQQVDEKLAATKSFEIERDPSTNLWVISSRNSYPADAEEQMKNAATAFSSLFVKDLYTVEVSEHSECRVVDPGIMNDENALEAFLKQVNSGNNSSGSMDESVEEIRQFELDAIEKRYDFDELTDAQQMFVLSLRLHKVLDDVFDLQKKLGGLAKIKPELDQLSDVIDRGQSAAVRMEDAVNTGLDDVSVQQVQPLIELAKSKLDEDAINNIIRIVTVYSEGDDADIRPGELIDLEARLNALAGAFNQIDNYFDVNKQIGFGTLISITDEKNNEFSLIIGEEVGENQSSDGTVGAALHLVRIPGEDAVFVAEIDVDTFTTEFTDWINDDLLDLDSIDVRQLSIHDYTSFKRTESSLGITERLQVQIDWNVEEGIWSLSQMLEFLGNDQVPVETVLNIDEELNADRLNTLQDAIDSLKISDVRRKPAGLGADLKINSRIFDPESRVDLERRGFFLVNARDGSGDQELLCANGELHISTEQGIKYLLRFGSEVADNDEILRHMFVTTRLDKQLLPEPELVDLPDVDPDDELTQQAYDEVKRNNDLLIEDHAQRIKDAEERVEDLNSRFADWYYLISEYTYNRLHLSKTDLIAIKEGTDPTGIDTFRDLEKQGLPERKAESEEDQPETAASDE